MKNQIDFYKIAGGRLGVINFNNMIPVIEGCYSIIQLNKGKKLVSKKEVAYYNLLDNQLRWLIRNAKNININAKKLYDKKIDGTLNKQILARCCDFKLLEEKKFILSKIVIFTLVS